MLLAVAGLSEEEIVERERRLASPDWAEFSAPERAAFAFARKQSRRPWAVDAADVRGLIERFGTERALDVIWWSCRCHYMTRVADGFQLPLERENVFERPPASTAASGGNPEQSNTPANPPEK
ncbi:MAG TPA: hypothetical protein VML55_00635 [Planctomycetaceae bacterium]|nr:hypothetical protein [Planctomycetaceae bacterium]